MPDNFNSPPQAAHQFLIELLSHNSYLLPGRLVCRPVFRRRNGPVPRRRGGNLPPGETGAGNAGAWYAPLQGHASHSDLCSSHHAGNAGSFGERVGVMGGLRIEVLSLALNGKTVLIAAVTPRYRNCSIVVLSLVQ